MRLSLKLISDASAPGRAETALRAFTLGLAPAVLADAQLVLAELIAGVVRRAPGADIRVQLELLPGGRLRGEFTPSPAAGELQVVARVSADWGVAATPTELWFELGPTAE